MEKTKVAIVKTEDPYGKIRTVLDMLSPHGLHFRNARILVKPNICSPFPPEQAAINTHPDVIGACIRYLKEEGAHTVWVGDEPVWGLRSRFAYQKSGVKEVVEKEGGKLVYFDEDKRVKKKVPGGRIYDSLSVPAILDEMDLLINLPKMKINMMALVSLCIKNLLGLASFSDRRRFHRGTDISYALIDIAKLVKPSLNIIDGIQALEGISAHSGSVRSVGVLIGSLDMVAADIVAPDHGVQSAGSCYNATGPQRQIGRRRSETDQDRRGTDRKCPHGVRKTLSAPCPSQPECRSHPRGYLSRVYGTDSEGSSPH